MEQLPPVIGVLVAHAVEEGRPLPAAHAQVVLERIHQLRRAVGGDGVVVTRAFVEAIDFFRKAQEGFFQVFPADVDAVQVHVLLPVAGAQAEQVENGGEVLGVIPRFMIDEGWCHKGLTETIVTADMHERKERMAQEADAVIALPGGCGTMEELFEIITWKQLGLFLNPIVILNIDRYYNPLIEMLHNAIGENFMRQEHARMWQVAQTPQEAVDAIQNIPVWDKNIRKIAAI